MSSDSEDEEQMKRFLEASDTTLLNNDMFKQKSEENVENIGVHRVKEEDVPKSQRYILDDEETTGTDFNLPESMQKHLAKKFSEILKKTYEFSDVHENKNEEKKMKIKSRVKLLKGDENYVKSYEEFEYESKGPDKKPEIKRRCVDQSLDISNDDQFKLVAIDGNDVLSGKEVMCWATKKERKDKIFHYREGANGIAHAKEIVNEFTALRRKNNWSEKKIKDFKRSNQYNTCFYIKKIYFGKIRYNFF